MKDLQSFVALIVCILDREYEAYMSYAIPPIYYDTETCGFHGPAVLIQYAIGDGPIILHEVWTQPAIETIRLIEMMMAHPGGVVGFNLSFDHFHLCQLYTTLIGLPDYTIYPEDHIDEIALLEEKGRRGPCLKPVTALDLMLYARKGPYQSTMNRNNIRIRRVPTVLAYQLATELERRIPISDIYFAKRKNKFAKKWQVYDIEDADGDIITDFKDIVLKFAPSSALKVLAIDALKLPVDTTLLFADIEIADEYMPVEFGYAPFATAIGNPSDWKGSWPSVIKQHIRHWAYHKLARQYAEKDVEYTRGLCDFFGSPELGDDDSVLACMVGAVRWKGFAIDRDGIRKVKKDAAIKKGKYPTAPGPAKAYIGEVMDETEKLGLRKGTKKTLLEEIVKIYSNQPCPRCEGLGVVDPDDALIFSDDEGEYRYESKVTCDLCNGVKRWTHPAGQRASEVLEARKAGKEIELYDKLLAANRFHADFVVIGTLSSRMSGTSGLNAQGIKAEAYVRKNFPLADPDCQLCGGDFAGFEVVLAIACYNDQGLMDDVLRKRPCHKCTTGTANPKCDCKGEGIIDGRLCNQCLQKKETCDECKGTGITDTKIHALFGLSVYPEMTYEEIIKNKEKYTRSKSALFALLYGGVAHTLKERLGVAIEIADKALELFERKYPGVAIARQRIINMFSALKQQGGIGTNITWTDPADYIESMLGFRRYFTLENRILRALYDLAQNPPKSWKIPMKIVRRERDQFVCGAVQSALFAAAFALQGAVTRAAQNHEIQSSGATITKYVQRKIWDIQPSGIGKWVVQPANVHDEILSPTDPAYTQQVEQVVYEAVEEFRPKVPLIKMEWRSDLKTWADK